MELGRISAGHRVLPTVPGIPHAYPVDLRVGTPMGQRWSAAIGGATITELQQGEARWQRATVRSDAVVSFGDANVATASAVAGFPAVRILRHTPFEGGSPEFLRAILNFYQKVLPAYPHDEIAVVQAPDRPVIYAGQSARIEERRWPQVEGHPGQIVIEGLEGLVGKGYGSLKSNVDRNHPHAVERGVAEALAADWWRRDYSRRDAWIGRALPLLYRDLFVDRAWGSEVVDAWRRTEDRQLTRTAAADLFPLAGLSDAGSAERGARLMRALMHRIGQPALLASLDRYNRSGDATLAGLIGAIRSVSGYDPADFFDAWVVVGMRPRISGSWAPGGDGVSVALASDVPFGRVEIPVRVQCRRSSTTRWIALVDGEATADLACEGAPVRVEVDPDGWLPLSARSLRRGPAGADPAGLRAPEADRVASSTAIP